VAVSEELNLYTGVPDPEDLVAAVDAIEQLIVRLQAAGYADEYAPVKASVLVRQLLAAWCVPIEIPERALLESNPEGSISEFERLEIRRVWMSAEGGGAGVRWRRLAEGRCP
jgi:hypothetical protein